MDTSKPKKKWYRWLVWLMFLVPPAVCVGVALYWVYGVAPVLTADTTSPWTLHLDVDTIAPGEELVASFYSCKTSEIEGTWSKSLIDTVEWNLVTNASRLPMGCGYHALVQQVPVAVPDGAYKLKLTVEYQVNPLSKQHFEFLSAPFQVKRPKEMVQRSRPREAILITPAALDRILNRLHQLEVWRYRSER